MRSNIEDEFIGMLISKFYSHHSAALSPGTTQLVLQIFSLSSIDQLIPSMDAVEA